MNIKSRKVVNIMKHLVAQNGLSYSIDIVLTFKMRSSEYKWFKQFEGLVECQSKINDDGVAIIFTINVNEEISKYGRFKDVPSRTEVERYMPILLESETFKHSDIVFIRNTIEGYVKKERFKGNNEPPEIFALLQEFKTITKFAEINIKNLVLNKKSKKQ